MAIGEVSFDHFSRQLAAATRAERCDGDGFRRKVQRWALIGSSALVLVELLKPVARLLRRRSLRDGEVAALHGEAAARARAQAQAKAKVKAQGKAKEAGAKDQPLQAAPQTAPQTIRLQPGDAPRLFAMLQTMRERHAAPAVDAVYLNDGLAAVAEQRMLRHRQMHGFAQIGAECSPAGGSPAGVENRLVIGRALLRILSVGDLRAVLAHELGHFAGGHGAMAARFRFLHHAWSQLGDGAAHDSGCDPGDDRGMSRLAPRPLVAAMIARWYLRRLMVLAMPLYRRAEFEADQFACRIAGERALARALIRTAMAQAGTDELMRADGQAPSLAARGAAMDDAVLLARALSEDTEGDDSHPCLRERLAALGQRAQLPPPLLQSALCLLDGGIRDGCARASSIASSID